MNCKTCPYKFQCKIEDDRNAICFAQGKPWEPQDDKRTVQADQSWWDKQKFEAERVVVE